MQMESLELQVDLALSETAVRSSIRKSRYQDACAKLLAKR